MTQSKQHQFSDKNLIKLEIGPGNSKISSEWHTVGDFVREGIVDKVCHWGQDQLPYENDTFDYVYSSHCLEHVPWYQTDYALSEVFRVLKPGGTFEVHVPNLKYIALCYLNKKKGDAWNKFGNQDHFVKWFSSRLFSYGPTSSNYHKSAFDEDYLKFSLEKCGFHGFEVVESSLAHVLHGNINIGVKCQK